MCKKTTLKIEELKNYSGLQTKMANTGLKYWSKRDHRPHSLDMLKYWQTFKEVMIKCKNDLLGNESIILEIANSKKSESIVVHTGFKEGTIEHYKHYKNEYKRIKELADNATGELANALYFELDGIRMILDSYEE